MNLEFSRRFYVFDRYTRAKFEENLSCGSQVVPCGRTDGRTDRHEETNVSSSQFCERAVQTNPREQTEYAILVQVMLSFRTAVSDTSCFPGPSSVPLLVAKYHMWSQLSVRLYSLDLKFFFAETPNGIKLRSKTEPSSPPVVTFSSIIPLFLYAPSICLTFSTRPSYNDMRQSFFCVIKPKLLPLPAASYVLSSSVYCFNLLSVWRPKAKAHTYKTGVLTVRPSEENSTYI